VTGWWSPSAWLRLALPHQALAVWYGVDRSTISAAVRQITPLLANRGSATPTGVRLHTLTDVLAQAAAEGLVVRLDSTEIQVRRPKAHRAGRCAFVSGTKKQNTIKASIASDARGRPMWAGTTRPGCMHDQTAVSAYDLTCRSVYDFTCRSAPGSCCWSVSHGAVALTGMGLVSLSLSRQLGR
jgi:membrane peptidoglycan carboxypeptidase